MTMKYIGAAILALGLVGIGSHLGPLAIGPAQAACDPGTHLDGTTPESTRRLLQRQGYHDIKIDQKGCDSVWHVFATKDGHSGRFAVEPGGRVFPEGN